MVTGVWAVKGEVGSGLAVLLSAAIVPPEIASSRAGERFGPQSFAWCCP
jgi:hypothetical protein